LKVHVIFTNRFHPEDITEINLKNCICAVIDTIRATSTITTMLGCGGSSIIVAGSKSEAFKLKKVFSEYILCGEEGGVAPEGFDYDNSPLEISRIDCTGMDFILMTTNGTRSIFKVKECREVFAISLLNLNYTIDCMVDCALKDSSDILILCSGIKGEVSYDDTFNAGLCIKYMLKKPYKFEFTDSSKLVLSAALSEFDITGALEKSTSAKLLRLVSTGDDISFLSHLNKYRVAPRLNKINIREVKPGNISAKELKSYLGYDTIYVLKKGFHCLQEPK